jgi:hypothetical protein
MTLAVWARATGLSMMRLILRRSMPSSRVPDLCSADLGLAPNNIRRFARAADPEELLVNDWSSQRPRMLDEYAPYLHQRSNQDCTDAAQLCREIQTRGYRGRYTLVRDYLPPPGR